MNNEAEIMQQLKAQNYHLKQQNDRILTELKIFSSRLNEQLIQKVNTEKNSSEKIKQLTKQNKLRQKQLDNVYKMYEIYKKQICSLKKSVEKNNKIQTNENQLQKVINENKNLRNEIKCLKKRCKIQEKGLVQLGADNYVQASLQNSQIREEICRLKLKILQLERIKQNPVRISRQKKQKTQPKVRSPSEQICYSRDQQYQSFQIKKNNQQNKVKELIRSKNKQREIIQNLMDQLKSKDEEITKLQEKIRKLRNINEKKKGQKTSQKLKKLEKHDIKLNSYEKFKQSEQLEKSEGQFKESSKYHKIIRYPRTQQIGLHTEGSTKWNHLHFSSKIKQIRIQPHKLGHVEQLQVRYQKGQSKMSTSHAKYFIFLCSESNQYVNSIEGGFKDDYLQYMIIKTNTNRMAKFCRYDIKDACQNFSFNIKSNEYPCALFGANDSQGVIQIGCFINKLQQ